ncbi:MAG: sulfate/molybdate ABC transporter ATP-binding protein [Rhodospirillaceae bacterium]
MVIEVRNVTKRFDTFTALRGLNLEVRPGELVALLGPSGSGKTTLLRVIAGLEFANEGQILFDGRDAGSRHVGERRVGFVFQHYALFRHMTVFENVAFGLRVVPRERRMSDSDIKKRVLSLLSLVQLDRLAGRYPSQLSGGQRQRVALARALAIEPLVLLLDEPFGALDAKVRKELRRWLRRLHDDMGLTSIFVTHDQEEALELADRVVVMNQGVIEQIGTPEEVYDTPATPFVYEFLGNVNRIPCRIKDGKVSLWGIDVAAETHDGTPIPAGDTAGFAYVRPHDIDLIPAGPGEPAVVRHVAAAGPTARIEVSVQGVTALIEAQVTRKRYLELGLKVGQQVFIAARAARVFPAGAAPALPGNAAGS